MSGEESRGQGIRRTLEVVAAMLRGQEITAHEVQEILRKQSAAAQRHLRALEAVFEPLGLKQRSTERGRAYSLPPILGDEPPARLSTAVAACFASSLATLFDQTEIGVEMRDATDRVVERAKRSAIFKHIDRKFFFHVRGGEAALPGSAGLLKDIVGALLEQYRLRIEYVDFDGTRHSSLDVQPLSIVVYDHQLYLIAAANGRPLHPYRFSRIEHVTVGSRFEYPPPAQYDPRRIFSESLGVFLDPDLSVEQVAVRLSGRWKTHVHSHRWHRSQTIDVDGDDIIVHLRVRQCPELESWILSFGDEAEVLKPDMLRQKIARRLAAAASRYDL